MRRNRLFLSFVVLTLSVTGSSRSSDLNSSLQVPPLKPEQRKLDGVQLWNGQIVVEVVGDRDRFNSVDLDSGSVAPLRCQDGTRVFDLAESVSRSFALCKGALGLRLFALDGDHGSREDLPKGLAKNKWHRICASSSTVFLLGKKRIYYRPIEGGPWNKVRYVPAIEGLHKTFPFVMRLLATENALYLGWNLGEWGGGLQKILIVDDGGHKSFEQAGALTEEPVRGIVTNRDGTVWAATGLAHMGLLESGLLQDDNSGTVGMISDSNYSGSSGSFSLPGETDISGVAVGPRGFPYIAATSLGVFEVSNSGLQEIFHANLRVEYKSQDPGSTLIVGSAPQGMVVPDEGTIVLATRSTGVLVFERQTDGFGVRQIIVPGSDR